MQQRNRTWLFFLTITALFTALGIIVPRALFLYPPVMALPALLQPRAVFSRVRAILIPAAVMVFTILGLCFISALWSVDPGGSLSRAVKIALILLPVLPMLGVAAGLEPPEKNHIGVIFAIIGALALVLFFEYKSGFFFTA